MSRWASSTIASSCSPCTNGAGKRLAALNGTGHATGIDIWSNVYMGGNSMVATRHNLQLELLEDSCSLVSGGAQEMPFPDAHFDVIVFESLPA